MTFNELMGAKEFTRWQSEQQRAFIEAQQHMAATVGATLELPEVAARVLDLTVRFIPCDTATLFLRYGDEMRVGAVYGLPAELIGLELNLGGPLLDEMLTTHAPVWLADAQADPGFVRTPHSDHIRGWLAAPLVIGERVTGQLSLDSAEKDRFSADDAHLLGLLARQAALALENAQLYAEATRRLQHMAILNEIASAVVSTPDFDEAVRRLVFAVKQSLNYEILNLYIRPNESGDWSLYASHTNSPGQSPLAWEAGVAAQAVALGRPVKLDDVPPHEAANPSEVRSQLCVPVHSDERVIGLIDAQSHRPAAFTNEDVHVLSIVAGQLAGALQNARLYAAERRRTEELQALLDVAETMSSSLNLPDMLKTASMRAVQVCRVDTCLVLLVTDDGEHLQLAGSALAVEPEPPPAWEALGDVLKQNTLPSFPRTNQALLAGRPVVFEVNDQAGPLTRFLSTHLQLHRLLLAPLRISDRSVGLMMLGNYEGRPEFDERQINLAAAIGLQLGVAVENAHLYARSRETVRDLSESISQLRQMQAQLIQSAKLAAVGQLAAGVAHEINNPLTTVSGFSELILRDLPKDSPIREDLMLILREGQRARNVVRRLLDFARQSEPHRDPSDLNEAVAETVMLMSHNASNQGILISETYEPDLPWAMLDANQFKQVVLNLLNNAVQAMPKGGQLTVTTGAEVREQAQGVWFKVADTGQGIPPQNLERIFEPFFTTKPPGVGTGLGLAVSYGIVNEHGGTIEVESTMGKGTAFTVWIPCNC
ncbi:MAG: GAF domain-containing protein [Chloroflexi bacterium]|nr:GAF domain-containing protein [Chloroflexota bacterium]